MASLTDLMTDYMSKVLPRYAVLEKQLTGAGKEDLKIVLTWVRDVFCVLNLYSGKVRDLEKEKVAMASEIAGLREQVQKLTQEKHELEQAVEVALKLDENQ